MMFDNVGKKIKYVAQIECWLGIIACLIYGIFTLVEGGNTIIGLYIIIIGSFCCWLASLGLYALGQITENSDIRTSILQKAVKENNGRYTICIDMGNEYVQKVIDSTNEMQFTQERNTESDINDNSDAQCNVLYIDKNTERCKLCGTDQRSGRNVCWKCGAKFIR